MAEVSEKNLFMMPQRNRGKFSSALEQYFSDTTETAETSGASVAEQEVEVASKLESVEVENESQAPFNLESAVVFFLPLESISLSPFQTRESFDEQSQEALAASIKQKGVLQPIIVRQTPGAEAQFELVAGERRFRAAQAAGMEKIPALVQAFSDQEALEVAIVENAQRQDLNPIEEALAFKMLQDRFKLNQVAIGEIAGKNRATVSNALRLLQLPAEVIELVKTGELSSGHARALLAIEDEQLQLRLAVKAVRDGLSVRALEGLVARADSADDTKELDQEEEKIRASLQRLTAKVADRLQMEDGVSLNIDSQGRKKLTITFPTEAAWKRFYSSIS